MTDASPYTNLSVFISFSSTPMRLPRASTAPTVAATRGGRHVRKLQNLEKSNETHTPPQKVFPSARRQAHSACDVLPSVAARPSRQSVCEQNRKGAEGWPFVRSKRPLRGTRALRDQQRSGRGGSPLKAFESSMKERPRLS
jgi:hypothetical protein